MCCWRPQPGDGGAKTYKLWFFTEHVPVFSYDILNCSQYNLDTLLYMQYIVRIRKISKLRVSKFTQDPVAKCSSEILGQVGVK